VDVDVSYCGISNQKPEYLKKRDREMESIKKPTIYFPLTEEDNDFPKGLRWW
jgi:hypothetical protein